MQDTKELLNEVHIALAEVTHLVWRVEEINKKLKSYADGTRPTVTASGEGSAEILLSEQVAVQALRSTVQQDALKISRMHETLAAVHRVLYAKAT